MQVHVLTIYPDMFPGPLGQGLIGKALEKKIWSLTVHDLRDFAQDVHKSVDAPAFGGGAGMVMMAPVIHRALINLASHLEDPRYIFLSPRGTPLTQRLVKTLACVSSCAHKRDVVLLCGRFEGVDQRVLDHWSFEEVSLGDFVLMGGEVAAMVLIEAFVRLLPGVLGNTESLVEESFENGLLEYPHYTRPRVWEGRGVPDVLLSGNHGAIETWRYEQRLAVTQKMRFDLWEIWTQSLSCDNKETESK